MKSSEKRIAGLFGENTALIDKCIICKKCCCGDEILQLTPYDVDIFSEKLDLNCFEFLEKYCNSFLDHQNFEQVVFKRNQNNECIFKINNLCSLPEKPFNCKLYKYGFSDFLYSEELKIKTRNPSCRETYGGLRSLSSINGVKRYKEYESCYKILKNNPIYIRLMNDDLDEDVSLIARLNIIKVLFSEENNNKNIKEEVLQDILKLADRTNDRIKKLPSSKEVELENYVVEIKDALSLNAESLYKDIVMDFINRISLEIKARNEEFLSAFLVKNKKELGLVYYFRGENDIIKVGSKIHFTTPIEDRIYIFSDINRLVKNESDLDETVKNICQKIYIYEPTPRKNIN